MKYTKKTKWFTHLGHVVTVEGMEDYHVANIIQFLSHYKTNNSLLEVLKKEAKNRGLKSEFLERAPIPYKDGQGNYLVWDFLKNKPKVVGYYIR